MVELKVKVSDKGQILIPKVLRVRYGIKEGEFVILKPTEEGLLIRGKPSIDEITRILDEHMEELRQRGVIGPILGELKRINLEMEFEAK